MITLVVALTFFAFSVFLHIVHCRQSPKDTLQGKVFLQLSLSFLFIFMAIGMMGSWPLLLSCSVIYFLLIPMYLVVYITTELMSPSKKIMMLIGHHGGCSYNELLAELNKEGMVMARLKELEQSGCVTLQDGRYRLVGSGKLLATILDLYGKIIGRGVGG